MIATFNGNPGATIICYSPTNVSDETELIAFYDELYSLVHSIPKNNILIIGRDMNAQIGKNGKQIQPTQLVKQKWTTSNIFHDRKEINMPQYKLSKRGGKTLDLIRT